MVPSCFATFTACRWVFCLRCNLAKGFHFQWLLLGLKCGCPLKGVFCQKKGMADPPLPLVFVFEGCCCQSYCLGVSFVWRKVGSRARSGSWLIVPVCSSSNLKLASAPPNGTMAVWECPVSLTAFWSFLAKVDGNRKAARGTGCKTQPSLGTYFSLFLAEVVGFCMIVCLPFLWFFASCFCFQVKNTDNFIFRLLLFYFVCTKIDLTLVDLHCLGKKWFSFNSRIFYVLVTQITMTCFL